MVALCLVIGNPPSGNPDLGGELFLGESCGFAQSRPARGEGFLGGGCVLGHEPTLESCKQGRLRNIYPRAWSLAMLPYLFNAVTVGDVRWQLSLVLAIESASPLPPTPDPKVFRWLLRGLGASGPIG